MAGLAVGGIETMKANKYLLLLASLGALILLVVAAVEENVLKDWRQIQRAARSGSGGIEVHLRQIVVPALRVTDRCTTCHVGMAPGEQGLTGAPILGPHPNVVHDPANFGCTVCHAGQGRATETADAHGDVPHWPKPMIPKASAYAGCGSCHTHLQVPNLALLQRGRSLFEQYDCLACHRLDGRGGTLRPAFGGTSGGMEGPDLSRVGGTGYRTDWYEDHLARRLSVPLRSGTQAGAKAKEEAWRASFAAIPQGDRQALAVFLSSRVGAPGLVEAKALFHSLGCRGCHRIGGVGGDDGPDLTLEGERDPGRLDFTHVPGKAILANWLAEHFRAPATLVPGSQMPVLGLAEDEIRLLTFYMFSLRRSEVPEAFWPKDRIRAERFGEREFSIDGATLYGTFCAACHGSAGQGMRYTGAPPFPAIANPDFLALASDEFITATVRSGRPGRRMPAWGEKDGGLRSGEIAEVVSHLRRLGGVRPEPDRKPRRWVGGDRIEGARLFAAYCAPCHGTRGEGKEGPALNNKVLLGSATDTYLTETIRRGRRGTAMEGFANPSIVRPALSGREIESIVTYLRTWEAGK
jgi:mono/diheme cytochrome c family protein